MPIHWFLSAPVPSQASPVSHTQITDIQFSYYNVIANFFTDSVTQTDAIIVVISLHHLYKWQEASKFFPCHLFHDTNIY